MERAVERAVELAVELVDATYERNHRARESAQVAVVVAECDQLSAVTASEVGTVTIPHSMPLMALVG